MFKWIDNIKKSILGKNKKSNKKKAKDVSDVNLDQLEDTKVLNVAQRAQGPKNRRLPKRPNRADLTNESISNSLTSSYDQSDDIKQSKATKDESPTVQHQPTVPQHQFKPNLNELGNCRLRTNKVNRISDSKENDLNIQIKSNETGNQFALNKVRASSMSILDDNLDNAKSIDKINIKTTGNEDRTINPDTVDSEECNEPSNVKQKRAQLMQQLKQIEIKNKCKSMVSLNQVDFRNESLEQLKTSPLRNDLSNSASKANKSNDYLNRVDSNSRLNINGSNPRLNLIAGRTYNKFESNVDKMNLNKVASLNSLNNLNNSRTNLVNVGDNSKLYSTHQQITNQPPAIPAKPLRKTTVNSGVQGVLNSNVSRNSSSSSSKSYSSTNSESNSGNFNNQSIESNLGNKSTTDSSSALKKRINSKKVLSRFQTNINDETNQAKPEVPGIHLLNNVNRTKFSNQVNVNRNRASLNLHNNNLDELTKKFMERGLSESVGSLKMLSNDEQNVKAKENDRSELEKTDLIMPTYV